jgi:GT2 family glycosyltransferase
MESESPLAVDLLVTTYRRAADVCQLLHNLERQTYQAFRLQIFDGSPDDETHQAVGAYLAGARGRAYPVVYHRTEPGMTRQRNLAVDHTQGDISVFLDDDVALEPDYLQQVVRVFVADTEHAIAGLNGWDLAGVTTLGVKKRIYRLTGLMPAVGCARYLPWGHPTNHQEGGEFTGIRDCDVLIGHNMAWRTEVLTRLRFAEFFVHYPTYVLYDDTDLSLRARRDHRLVQCGDARLRHRVSPSGRPPGFHYGFQTVFNAHRNWCVHRPRATLHDRCRFWLWEGIAVSLLALRSVWQPHYRGVIHGMLAGGVAAVRGVADFSEWQSRGGRA